MAVREFLERLSWMEVTTKENWHKIIARKFVSLLLEEFYSAEPKIRKNHREASNAISFPILSIWKSSKLMITMEWKNCV